MGLNEVMGKTRDDQGIHAMKREMIKSLSSRFARVEENRLLSTATILDPCFKDKFFASNIIKTTVKEMLEEEIQKIVGDDVSHKAENDLLHQDHPLHLLQNVPRRTPCLQCILK